MRHAAQFGMRQGSWLPNSLREPTSFLSFVYAQGNDSQPAAPPFKETGIAFGRDGKRSQSSLGAPSRMSLFGRAACLFNRHDPNRRRVNWDGWNYVGHCRHCGIAIERVGVRRWRRRDAQAPGTSRDAAD